MKLYAIAIAITSIVADNCSTADMEFIGGSEATNKQFFDKVDFCARDHMWSTKKIDGCIYEGINKKVSESCVKCYAEGARCTLSNCKLKCMSDKCASGCVACTRKNCNAVVEACAKYRVHEPCEKWTDGEKPTPLLSAEAEERI